MTWVVVIYTARFIEVPLNVRTFSQVNLRATQNQKLPCCSSSKLLLATFNPGLILSFHSPRFNLRKERKEIEKMMKRIIILILTSSIFHFLKALIVLYNTVI